MRVFAALAASAAALTLSACATTATTGGPLQPLPVELAEASRIDSLIMTSEWVAANEDFGPTFSDAVLDRTRRCFRGERPLQLRVHVTEVRRADRALTVLNGRGVHEISALAEYKDLATGQIVGRELVALEVDAGGPFEALFEGRQLKVSDAFGQAICDRAFER